MGTPHRGTDLAETLNRILAGSVFGHSPKEYISELARNSPTIDEMNESFRHHARKLQIFSFYETLGTNVGPVNTMILDKTSSVLGYDNETHQPLIANHHDVSKFSSPQDPNYSAVCGALKSIVANIEGCPLEHGEDNGGLESLRSWLGVSGAHEEDLALLHSIRKPGTCRDFLETQEYRLWLDSSQPRLLWAHAPPGSGKSIQCSHVIDSLREGRAKVAFWFFKYDDASKRSVANMLRSVAYQIAFSTPSFRRELADLKQSGLQVRRADAVGV